jgi:hypothetical protein
MARKAVSVVANPAAKGDVAGIVTIQSLAAGTAGAVDVHPATMALRIFLQPSAKGSSHYRVVEFVTRCEHRRAARDANSASRGRSVLQARHPSLPRQSLRSRWFWSWSWRCNMLLTQAWLAAEPCGPTLRHSLDSEHPVSAKHIPRNKHSAMRPIASSPTCCPHPPRQFSGDRADGTRFCRPVLTEGSAPVGEHWLSAAAVKSGVSHLFGGGLGELQPGVKGRAAPSSVLASAAAIPVPRGIDFDVELLAGHRGDRKTLLAAWRCWVFYDRAIASVYQHLPRCISPLQPVGLGCSVNTERLPSPFKCDTSILPVEAT